MDPSRGSELHQRMIRRPDFHRIEPGGTSDLNVRHVPLDGTAVQARTRAYEWAHAVWDLYREDHGTVRVWLDEAGFNGT